MSIAHMPKKPRTDYTLWAGVAAGFVAALVIGGGYFLRFPASPLGSWTVFAVSALGVGVLSGGCLGAGVAAGHMMFARTHGGVARQCVGAGLGAFAGGLVPSLLGVVGYGSLSAPYAGTDLAAMGVLSACFVFSVLFSLPVCRGQTSALGLSKQVLCATGAAALVIIPFGVTAASMATAALPLDVLRQMLAVIGGSNADSLVVLCSLSAAIALVFGMLVGTFVGLTHELARLLRSAWK